MCSGGDEGRVSGNSSNLQLQERNCHKMSEPVVCRIPLPLVEPE